jgi:monoterpene epsilon-lactone hydrolase
MALPVNGRQAATISPEAMAFLRSQPSLAGPSSLYADMASPAQVPVFRAQFQEQEDIVEEKIIADHDLVIERDTISGVPVVIVHPRQIAEDMRDKAVLNIHGGGFTIGTGRERTALLTAAELGATVYSVDYALSPDAAFPAAIEQCLAVYRDLTARIGGRNLVGVASSSGGQIMLAMINRARGEGLPMVAALGLYTPASDISGDGDSGVVNSERDLMPTDLALAFAHLNYVPGADLHDPAVSPIYASYDAGFPPAVLNTGTRDSLMSNSIRLYWVLREAGVDVELLVSEGMWHGFNWEPALPEAIRARTAVYDFLRARLSRAADPDRGEHQ